MTSHPFHSLFEIQQTSNPIARPPAVKQKSLTVQTPSAIELDRLAFADHAEAPSANTTAPQTPCTGTQTPITPSVIEAAPDDDSQAAGLVQTMWNPPINKWRILCACLVQVANGLNDSAPGPLIPYMEKDYSIGYAVVSTIFVTNAAGFIAAAFACDAIETRLGRAKTLMLSEAIMMVGYIILACTPPFGAVVAAFFPLGFGFAIPLALNNVFCSNLANATVVLGLFHGCYGLGGTIGPIIATTMASHGTLWSRFYLIPLGIRAVCIIFNGWSFKDYEKEAPVQLLSSLERTASLRAQGTLTKGLVLKKALNNRTTIFGALFIFVYQGAEVSVSGWVISYLITYRNGDPGQVGYVTAGFFGGITLGRFTLTHLAPRVGEKRFVYGLIMGSIAFQLLVWQIPNVVGDAVAVSIVGLLLGPIYPCGQTIFSQLLPKNIQTSAVGIIAGAGSSGGAIAPFTVGILSQAVGTFVLHPVCMGLYVVMMVCWFGLPPVRKRSE
ncbi:MFS general substrate transporter [Saccharata proteae CBS 121410]|uniref:MFS general substrate transporter n=1 Tax=Saccharata proteae CBS 121410 TaxID=1314787 RepID=A0A9P4LRJ2_9PEZI|nr:MFS general substrate transporter [Saccharata proteae CBS 121410]